MVNPDKLKALVDMQSSAAPSPEMLGVDAPPEEGDEDSEDGTEPVEPSERGDALLAEWGEFGETLGEEADMLHDLAHDVGAELLLKDVPDDAIKAVEKAVDRMPDELQQGLAKYVGELSDADCEALATALTAKIGEDKADLNLLCAFLSAAGKYAKEEIEVDEDFNKPDEDEEPHEETEEEEAAESPEHEAAETPEEEAAEHAEA